MLKIRSFTIHKMVGAVGAGSICLLVSACQGAETPVRTDTGETLLAATSDVPFEQYLRERELLEVRTGLPDPTTGISERSATIDKGSLVLQLEESVSIESFEELMARRSMTVIKAYPQARVVHVTADLSEFIDSTAEFSQTIEYSLDVADNIKTAFEAEPAIRIASPDIVLSLENTPLKIEPIGVFNSAQASSGEVSDWGLGDLNASSLWTEENASDGVIIGFLDAGFGRHEDLTFVNLKPDAKRHNHGNHVAGIACAEHNNVGTKGIVPRCFAHVEADPIYYYGTSPDKLIDWNRTFSQIIGDFNVALSAEGVNIYNVSMGYNWMPNFNMNIDSNSESAQKARGLVDGNGEIILSFYKTAKKDIIVYSAAGNDSYSDSGPISVKYASPFNWAAKAAEERGLSVNAAIVEAHDQSGQTATFSNVGGHLSCPGVDIVSVLAFDSGGSPSRNTYGTMSGTSMASPYCAGSHALLSVLRPNKSNQEILDCLLIGGETMETGATKVDLALALKACT